MNERQPLANHPVMQAIQTAVGHLVMPDLAPLPRVFMDMQADLQAGCTALEQQMESLRLESQDAATHLMLPDTEQLKAAQKPYFTQSTQKRGSRNE